jgi:cytochrome c oxidase subunit 2
MRQKTFFSITCIAGIILVSGTFSCCVNCPYQPKGGEPPYSVLNMGRPPSEVIAGGELTSASDANQPSGEIIEGVRVIKMTAKRYEYNPSVITVNQSDKVRLEITSLDVKHGFALKAYKIDRKLEPGKTEIIEFTADKAGKFEFHCSVFCGLGHFGMKGKLIVKPK